VAVLILAHQSKANRLRKKIQRERIQKRNALSISTMAIPYWMGFTESQSGRLDQSYSEDCLHSYVFGTSVGALALAPVTHQLRSKNRSLCSRKQVDKIIPGLVPPGARIYAFVKF